MQMKNSSKNIVRVVAALIWQNGRFLACQRPPQKARGLLWEFVGGKVEPGETKQQALIRECQEELAITVAVAAPVMTVKHEYPDITIELTLFEARIVKGKPQLLEHCDLRWLTAKEIDDYDFCPADVEILDWLKAKASAPVSKAEKQIKARLISMHDESYQKFHCALIPNVPSEQVLGVRMPLVRSYAKELFNTPLAQEFLNILPHRYYEENNLHGLLIAQIQDIEVLFTQLDRFLPYVDNWATCDAIRPAAFKKRPEQLMLKIREWIASDSTYTIRFALEMLMTYYLDDGFNPEQLELAANLPTGDYYVDMMIAWYFATALVKQWDSAFPVLQQKRLSVWVHNKTIQKALESLRITPEQKAILRSLKRN